MDDHRVTGIILAGGASRRMGKDKGLCYYKGKQLVSYSIEVLKPICDNIIIGSNNPDEYSKFGYEVIVDEIKNIGPIGGIYSCLKKSSTKRNLIVSCDTPYLNKDSLNYILESSNDYEIVIPQHANLFYEPLAGYYSSSIVAKIEESIVEEDYKLINLFNKVKFKAISTDNLPGSVTQFKNFNTPEELV